MRDYASRDWSGAFPRGSRGDQRRGRRFTGPDQDGRNHMPSRTYAGSAPEIGCVSRYPVARTNARMGCESKAFAQTLETHRIPAALALEAVAECARQGYTETAVLVDVDGVRQAVLRGNRAGAHTLDSAFEKAYTAAYSSRHQRPGRKGEDRPDCAAACETAEYASFWWRPGDQIRRRSYRRNRRRRRAWRGSRRRLGRFEPFATPLGNNRYLHGADGRS